MYKAAELKRFRSHPLSSAVNPGTSRKSETSDTEELDQMHGALLRPQKEAQVHETNHGSQPICRRLHRDHGATRIAARSSKRVSSSRRHLGTGVLHRAGCCSMLAALCGRSTQALGVTVGRCVSTCRPTGMSSLRGHVALDEALLRWVLADPSSPRPPKPARWDTAHPWFLAKLGPALRLLPTPTCIFCRSLRSNPTPLSCRVVLKC